MRTYKYTLHTFIVRYPYTNIQIPCPQVPFGPAPLTWSANPRTPIPVFVSQMQANNLYGHYRKRKQHIAAIVCIIRSYLLLRGHIQWPRMLKFNINVSSPYFILTFYQLAVLCWYWSTNSNSLIKVYNTESTPIAVSYSQYRLVIANRTFAVFCFTSHAFLLTPVHALIVP